MTPRWIRFNNHLALEYDDKIVHPSSSDIYSLVFDNDCNLNYPNLSEQFPDLHFSKIGSPLKCEISIINGHINLQLFAKRINQSIKIDMVNGHIIDHALTSTEWFYINNDYSLLESMFEHSKIKECGSITINQYIGLIRQECFFKNKEIINNINKDDLMEFIIPSGNIPTNINATLYNYQKTGFLWMNNMLSNFHGCILGDEMGLGKTLQIITVFQELKNKNKIPLLVVAPVSLLENWKRECNKFAPQLNVYIHHGPKRTGFASELEKHDVVVISYSTAVSDLSMLKMINWECVVLDEAQNIKNPYSERSKATKAITRNNGIAVSGTPFENHITDIWSLVDFSVPGLLGNLNEFQKNVSDDIYGAEIIEPILSPIMIRRLVKEVANDLPEKVVIPQPIVMSENEKYQYEVFRQEAISEAANKSVSLTILQKLRMYCTHPYICNDDCYNNPYQESVKYQRLCEIVEEIVNSNEKVIVFTSYKKMFEIFKQDIPKRFFIDVDFINGDTPVNERQKIVDWFNEYAGPAMLVLNPHAAGTGLNITGANHVIHYNLEWNPAVEDQATARAYRKGQNKTVFVYRLYYINTVEEVVNDRIERKRDIASTAIVGTDGFDDNKDIIRALELAPEINKKG